MGWWVAVILIVAIAVGGGVYLLARSRRSVAPPAVAEPSTRPAPPPPTPMTDLESALSKVTDRQGRPIKERIDAESVHVDPLRDPDDTGPLLRRALDSVEHHEDGPHPDDVRPSGE